MIYTGYYAKTTYYVANGLTPIAISGSIPHGFNYYWWRFLAPSWDIYSKWKNGEIGDDGYISRYIPERLEILDKDDLKRKIDNIENPIFLCYEKEGFCHRHVLADWLNFTFGYSVEEYK